MTTRTLLLLRHARTVPARPGEGDHARALYPGGHRDAALIARTIAEDCPRPDLILSSTARRTREMSAAVLAAFALPPPILYEDALYLAEVPDILARLARLDAGVGAALVVGHNPGLEDAARLLAGTGEMEARMALSAGMPPGALAMIAFDAGDWRGARPGAGRLLSFVTPQTAQERGRADS